MSENLDMVKTGFGSCFLTKKSSFCVRMKKQFSVDVWIYMDTEWGKYVQKDNTVKEEKCPPSPPLHFILLRRDPY